MRYIDVTPRWVEILPTWLMMVKQAATGDCTNPDLILDNATKEFFRMAQAADNYGDLVHYFKEQGWTAEHIQETIKAGRELREQERNTVKESDDA